MVKLKRKSSVTDNGCAYKVYVDNKFFCKIEDNQEIGFEIGKGKHTLQVKSPYFRSDIIEFDVDTDEFLSFICYPKYTNSKITKTVIKLLSNSVGIALEKNVDYYF